MRWSLLSMMGAASITPLRVATFEVGLGFVGVEQFGWRQLLVVGDEREGAVGGGVGGDLGGVGRVRQREATSVDPPVAGVRTGPPSALLAILGVDLFADLEAHPAHGPGSLDRGDSCVLDLSLI